MYFINRLLVLFNQKLRTNNANYNYLFESTINNKLSLCQLYSSRNPHLDSFEYTEFNWCFRMSFIQPIHIRFLRAILSLSLINQINRPINQDHEFYLKWNHRFWLSQASWFAFVVVVVARMKISFMLISYRFWKTGVRK